MKKLFALMLVVAMLSVAGSAMAVTGTASPATVNMTAGGIATSTVTGVAGEYEGDLSYALSSSAPAWATLTNNVVTFKPGATVTGTSSVVVTVTETYTTDGGHSTSTATADVTITVNVAAPQLEPEPEPETEDETTTVIEKVKPTITSTRPILVVIISSVARQAASVLTFSQTVRTVATAIADTGLLQRIGLSQALAQAWAGKAAQVAQMAQNAINSAAKRAALFTGLAANVDTTPQDNDQLEEVPGSTTDSADAGTKLAAATERLGGNRKALSAGGAMRPKKSGTYKFAKNFGPALYKLPIQGDRGNMGGAANAFSASAVDTTGVAFIDSAGNATTIIPGDENSQDIMPGFVTMLVVMEAGQIYEPVIFTTSEDLTAAGISTDSQPATVNVVDYSQTETVVVDADGNETVQEDAPAATLAGMATVLGSTPTRVPTSALLTATAIKSADAAADKAYAASHDMFIAATYAPVGALTDGVYYAPVTFNELGSGQTLADDADFEFYPDGLGASAEKAYVAVFTMSGDEVTTPSSILGKEGYIAFAVESSVFRAAAKDNEMDRPTVTLALKASTTSPDQPVIEDSVFENLKTQGYINASNQLTSTAFVGGSAPTLTAGSDGKYTATVSLVFDVSEWILAVAENGSVTKQFSSSAISNGSLTPTGTRTATISLDPSEITAGSRAVTLTVTPDGATHTASTSLGSVIGTYTGTPTNVLGSSGGGCSAGSAVLALALLGSFILTRKK
ncbi:MAG: hypothetical protein IJP89_08685 [Synergistaceae bacterium]|nr:hypothetical protein [Synergistaceae bacterium]